MGHIEDHFYVYRFLDKTGQIIYVGKTNHITKRIYKHLNDGHLPQECYNEVSKIEYFEAISRTEMDIYELYLINMFGPSYNSADNRQDGFTFHLPEKEWQTFNKKLINHHTEELLCSDESETEALNVQLSKANREIDRTCKRIKEFYMKSIKQSLFESNMDLNVQEKINDVCDYIDLELTYLKHYDDEKEQERQRQNFYNDRGLA